VSLTRTPIGSLTRRRRARAGFSTSELLVALMIVGLTTTIGLGRFHNLLVQFRVDRAATAVQNDLESAFAISQRNRKPINITWNATTRQLGVTNRAGTVTYRRVSLAQDYGLQGAGISFSSSPIEVYPNGMANNALTITLQQNGYAKRVNMTRSGMVTIR
jgi:Tfp pilus assembly protein FimT